MTSPRAVLSAINPRRALARAKIRRYCKRHGLVAVDQAKFEQVCADCAVLLIIEIEAELARVAGEHNH